MLLRLPLLLSCLLLNTLTLPQTGNNQSQVTFVTSKDGTRIAIECSGKGPNLLIVHGGAGDRTRWKPLLPLFESHFRVCAMDRRGHGESQVGTNYALQKEIDDVVAAAHSQPGPVFVLGHSIGGVIALEASFLTSKISKLVLYEPPLQDLDHSAVADQMEKLIHSGNREEALFMFLREIVKLSPKEIDAMKARPNWSKSVASIEIQIREIRWLSKYRLDTKRLHKLKTPTLLFTGSETASPQLKQAIETLMNGLPNRELIVFEGQEHNAMDIIPERFAGAVTKFLQQTRRE